jgi:2',3'-cyclic-nucleotide 2'-phosphodiesterase (5'-nucleotidase family)
VQKPTRELPTSPAPDFVHSVCRTGILLRPESCCCDRDTFRPTSRCWQQLVVLVMLLIQVWWKLLLVPCFIHYVATRALSVVPDLPLGDINVLVVTDTHSWVGGQTKYYTKAATYGEIISFVQHMKEYIADSTENRDLWFVMNGDWIDGTGLALNGDASHLVPILEKMPYDAVNIGNHELYKDSVIQYMTSAGGMVDWFGEKYLSSNVRLNATKEPIGSYFHILKGRYSNLLTFGFLYNMKNCASSVVVEEVESVVQESWFVDVLKRTYDYDAILVLAHMDVRDPLCQIILDAIRSIAGTDIPVQFITGHTHIRDYQVFDHFSSSFEAGHFLDTLGFVSFPSSKSVKLALNQSMNETNGSLNSSNLPLTALFKYQYINATVDVLAETLDLPVESFPTEDGVAQMEFIARTRNKLGLDKVVGCVGSTYYFNRTLDATDSLWGFFKNQIVPSLFGGQNVVFLGNGGWRYDLYKGEVRLDDLFGVSPFNNSFWMWNDIPATVIVALNTTFNALPSQMPTPLPNFILSPAQPFQIDESYSLIVDSYELSMIEQQLRTIIPNDTSFSTKTELSGVTSTSIWIDYFTQISPTCSSKFYKPKENNPFSSHNGQKDAGDTSVDTIRLAFVGTAVTVMIILTAILVHQKSAVFRRLMDQRQFAVMEAIREYEQDDVVYVDESEDGDLI